MKSIYDTLMLIKRTSGFEAKKKIMLANPQIKMCIVYAMDPFRTFGINIPKSWMTYTRVTSSTGEFTKETKTLLDRLANRELTGNKAKVILKSYLDSLNTESALLLKLIVNKELKIGMGPKSINKVWPDLIPIHEVALCVAYTEADVKLPVLASYKVDGMRGTYRNSVDTIVSRLGLPISACGSLSMHVDKYYRAESQEPDGEVYIKGLTFEDNMSLLKRKADCPQSKFYIFDDMSYAQTHFEARYGVMSHDYFKYLDACKKDNVEPRVVLLTQELVTTMERLNEMYEEARQLGFEGLVLADPKAVYPFGRTKARLKMKPGRLATDLREVDLEVTGVYEGQYKYEGMLGGIICSYNGKEVRVGTGFTDVQRAEFWQIPELIIGEVVNVLYMEETVHGVLRHTSFNGIKHDRYPEDI